MGVNQFYDLVMGTDFLRCNFVELVRQTFQLRLYDGIIHVVLALEVSIKRTPAFPGGLGYIIHCRVGNTVLCKELTCHINKFLSGFRY